ncbi:MAG: GNAT family N-acetyltransferase [Deltaproteobacteria bacterium]|nr:GNAT family N-acetyltransferase [Deltaproteobacteria bacterium]
MTIRKLADDDDRQQFSSGDADLDRFFHQFAGQNQFKHHIGTTYVAVDQQHIRGYVTIAPGSLEIERLPARDRKRLPSYPAPILRLARLAVDHRHRGAGIGEQLLRHVLLMAASMASDYGCIGILVDAKPAAVDFYARYGFESIDLALGDSPARPSPTPMFLPISDVVASLR